ncbi:MULTISPECIES: hypothetical protein [Halomonadaceae]|uniref:Uncharacterized protein n=1 Tax=Modicisalibacter ilicicola DSM 19980 TaxID=1121942 RepID=A0A1M5EZV9_9GAMM|nr:MULTISPECIES: hypothetical protein [Halomonas]SHF84657.1 hypothetical protein SAMN02745148_03679 [Halomonas ilicicola DSM 19980]
MNKNHYLRKHLWKSATDFGVIAIPVAVFLLISGYGEVWKAVVIIGMGMALIVLSVDRRARIEAAEDVERKTAKKGGQVT